VVSGTGTDAGAALVGHPDVALVSFTGSTAVGRQVMATAAGRAARVHLELGGKAPFVVFDDADLEAAVHGAVAGSLINAGQDCTAATRAYVHTSLYDAFVSGVADLMAGVRMGDPTDSDTDLGPLSSARHRDKVAAMVDRASVGGAKTLAGAAVPAGEHAGGFWYPPTLVIGAAQDSEIVRDEVFGPVLTVLPFDTDDEAFALANDSPYGLSGTVFSSDPERASGVAARMRVGTVNINGGVWYSADMPFGGYKQSGIGREMGLAGFEEYLETKAIATGVN
jgi:betaine-aldehyde dehydrogenase